MYKKKIFVGLIPVILTTAVFAQQPTNSQQQALFQTCQSYLTKYISTPIPSIPQLPKVAQIPTGAAKTIKTNTESCIILSACQNPLFSATPSCALKLSLLNLYASAAMAATPTSGPLSAEPPATQSPAPAPVQTKPNITPTAPAPAEKQTSPSNNDNEQSPNNNKINWF